MTPVGLLNKALAYLGEARVQSLSQPTNSAKIGHQAMRESVEEVLRRHRWNSATKRKILSQLSDGTLFGGLSRYQLPTDYVKFVEINGGCGDYAIEGDKLVTSEGEVELLYIHYPDDFGILSPDLIAACAANLAFNISINVTGQTASQDRMGSLYERLLAIARTTDARESSDDAQSLYQETLNGSDILRARHSNSWTRRVAVLGGGSGSGSSIDYE